MAQAVENCITTAQNGLLMGWMAYTIIVLGGWMLTELPNKKKK